MKKPRSHLQMFGGFLVFLVWIGRFEKPGSGPQVPVLLPLAKRKKGSDFWIVDSKERSR